MYIERKVVNINFESIEEVFDRIEDVINEVREDSRYVESLDV